MGYVKIVVESGSWYFSQASQVVRRKEILTGSEASLTPASEAPPAPLDVLAIFNVSEDYCSG